MTVRGVLQEQISTRVKIRPELEKALAPAHQFKEAAPETPVILTVHEIKRLARNAASTAVPLCPKAGTGHCARLGQSGRPAVPRPSGSAAGGSGPPPSTRSPQLSRTTRPAQAERSPPGVSAIGFGSGR
ncbi:hypothetical protein [Streptomyces sp. NPDC059515]|uniref:hypothetical protein n=1 Tax=Streptomyces sp. NPDC059515 TaxID=3346854 RepID=UPI0036A3D15C